MTPNSYKEAGVDIDTANELITRIKPLARGTARLGADGSLGGFGALFDLKATGIRDPVLVSTTDGVGTKLKIAIDAGIHDTIGIDLVAMCVNDIVVQGAQPLFFLDYFATGKINIEVAYKIIDGIARGCRIAGCALVGGETAEMPGLYAEHDYDLAGFAVGAVERDRILPRTDIAPGDIVLGIASSGLHANGFSLIRHIMAAASVDASGPAPFDSTRSLAAALLEPTRIYVAVARALAEGCLVKGFAHITGGGLLENLPRILPAGIAVRLDASTWTLPPVIGWAAQTGHLAKDQLFRVFNCGIGMVAIIPAGVAEVALALALAAGEAAMIIGEVVPALPDRSRVDIGDLPASWGL